MKAKIQILIGIVTAILMIIGLLLAFENEISKDLKNKRETYALKAQQKTYALRRKQQEELLKKAQQEVKERRTGAVSSAAIIEDTSTGTRPEIEKQFQLEAKRNVSYKSVLFERVNLISILIFLPFVGYIFTAYRRLFYVHIVLFLIIFCMTVKSFFIVSSTFQFSTVKIAVTLSIIFGLLLLQPTLGIITETKNKSVEVKEE